jgi:hypothetical protein
LTVLLAEWSLTADYFDGAVLDGPVPRFFAANPTEARAALSADTPKAYKDLQRIFSPLFITENIPACEAWDFVGNPRKINVIATCFFWQFRWLQHHFKKTSANYIYYQVMQKYSFLLEHNPYNVKLQKIG